MEGVTPPAVAVAEARPALTRTLLFGLFAAPEPAPVPEVGATEVVAGCAMADAVAAVGVALPDAVTVGW